MEKYVVRSKDEERDVCEDTIARLRGSSQLARHARILPQVDANGPAWTTGRAAKGHSAALALENRLPPVHTSSRINRPKAVTPSQPMHAAAA
ncbi:MAG: hypothetical protein OXN89_15940 [Bryobacterales bacterium]|nr:hypothetical protein [Bryobacterales bacterium]